MNILFDFLTFQKKTGSAEYGRAILFSLFEKIKSEQLDVNVFALYDSSIPIAYDDLQENALLKSHKVEFLDCRNQEIGDLICCHSIDIFNIVCH